ncbi:hypothetical protein [Actinacidiphila yeochonensis]|uniref:hypothetical protein n=1 Tax=Actinacidiphila yeochonensis TaxID=89050 RepID=UPI0005685EA9|nr:hypothetical protein [Actinacidiphila yeochonensis]
MGDEEITFPFQGPGGRLEIGVSRWSTPHVLGILCVANVVWLLPDYGSGWKTRAFVSALFGLAWFVAYREYRQVRDKGTLVRIDAAGVTVLGEPTVPWADISRVLLTSRSTTEGVVFIARPGVRLPFFQPLMFLQRREVVARRRIKDWGTPLVLVPAGLDIPARLIVDAVRCFGDGVPVESEGPRTAG